MLGEDKSNALDILGYITSVEAGLEHTDVLFKAIIFSSGPQKLMFSMENQNRFVVRLQYCLYAID